jgi:hypothetical protein
MTRITRWLIAAGLVTVTAASCSAAAVAEPAYYECNKVAEGSGKYSNTKCSVLAEEGKGKYELEEGIGKGKAFKGSGGKLTWHNPSIGGVFECKTAKDSGKVTSPTEVAKVVITFVSCVSLGKKCTTTGQVAGTIKTAALHGTLGYISLSPLRVGIDLSAEEPETNIADYNCEGLQRDTSGSIIGEQTGDINVKIERQFSWVFQVNGEGFQEIQKFEGGPEDVLEELVNGSGPFEAAIQATTVQKGEELEVKA